MRLVFLFLFTLVAPAIASAQEHTAAKRYESLIQSLQSARKSKDYPAYLAAAQQFRDFLNSSPESVVPVIRANALSGNIPAALDALREYVAMGQSSDEFLNSPDFAALRDDSNFATIAAGMRANQTPISALATGFTLDPLTSRITEDVAYDSDTTKGFYFTTVLGKDIFVAPPDGKVREFAAPPTDLPLLAIKVDSPRGILWVSAVGLRDFAGVPKSAEGKSILLSYALSSGKLLRQLDGPPNSALGDFAISPSGDLFLADNNGALYLLPHDASTFERLDHGEFISPQTPALSSDARLLFIPDYARGIAVLDRSSRTLRWLDPQGKFALSGIDGLYFYQGKLIATQNGTSPERVAMFTLDPTLTRITSQTIIERATSTLGDPTHGVIVGKSFFYIANSGWDILNDDGSVKSDSKPTPVHIMRTTLH